MEYHIRKKIAVSITQKACFFVEQKFLTWPLSNKKVIANASKVENIVA
jgi:hypothetical protein